MQHVPSRAALALLTAFVMAACGGGGGGGADSPSTSTPGSSSAPSSSQPSSSASSSSDNSSTSANSSSSSSAASSSSSTPAASSSSSSSSVDLSIKDALTLTDTAAQPLNGWSGWDKIGIRSYLPASDKINTSGHVSTATPAPGTPTVYPVIASDPSNGVFTIERDQAPMDGWHAFYRDGAAGNHKPVRVSGGASAAANRIYTCGTKKCIFDAIKEAKNEPKIIRVFGNIDMRVDDDGVFREWTSWDDQKGSSILLPSNTTLVGLNAPDGSPARLISAQIEIGKEFTCPSDSEKADYKCWIDSGKDQEAYPGWTRNVIVRNLWIQTNYDVQPEGSADAYFDGMAIAMAQQVWVDNVTITDGQYNDYLVKSTTGGTRHDGALDIIRGSDYVTVSNSEFRDHGKTTLVSNSDSGRAWSDENRFHVTFKANYYKDTGSRVPRVRWGQVHIYNNYVEGDREAFTAAKPFTKFETGVGMGYKGDVLMESTLWNIEPTKTTEVCQKIVTNHGSSTSFRQNKTWLKSQKYLPAGVDVSGEMSACSLPAASLWAPPYSYVAEANPLNLECAVKARAGAGKIGLFATVGSCTPGSSSSSSAASSGSSSAGSSASSSSSSSTGGSLPAATANSWEEDFTAAADSTFFTTTYRSLPGDASKPLYNNKNGTISFNGGVMTLNGGRFTVGALAASPATSTTVSPGGIFDIVGNACTLSVTFAEAGAGDGKKFQVYVDNNTTSGGASPHGSNSKIVELNATALEANSYEWPISLDTAGFSGGSFLQIRTESGATVKISRIALECDAR